MKSRNKQSYTIPFRSLAEGLYTFDYELNEAFFEQFETLLEFSGKVAVEVEFLKKDSKLEVKVNMGGTLQTVCDRCLDPLDLPFSIEEKYYIREAEDGESEEEDVIFVAPESVNLELSQTFYELIMIGLPQKRTHKKENCNKEMLEKLEALKIKKEEKVDPRWAALEKLTKKEK